MSGLVKLENRVYRCSQCKTETTLKTNHTGEVYSQGSRFLSCPSCPPWRKYAEFGGMTVWQYVRESSGG
jgi:DNA-directed RNA polymerase subunit RPC12/RpoP